MNSSIGKVSFHNAWYGTLGVNEKNQHFEGTGGTLALKCISVFQTFSWLMTNQSLKSFLLKYR